MYGYVGVVEKLLNVISRDELRSSLDQWKQRKISDGVLCDIYEGIKWKDNANFFNGPGVNLGLSLFVDWFNPFSRSAGEIGLIVIVILNLPRQIRFKIENLIVAGVIPGPKEPALNINSFLKPIVNDLKELEKGILDPCDRKTQIRGKLLQVIADMPARCKTIGSMSFNATQGCHRCSLRNDEWGVKGKTFEIVKQTSDALKKNDNSWRIVANQYKVDKTVSTREALARSTGIRYSYLLELDGYSPCSSPVIEPMHLLWQNACQDIFKSFISKGVLSPTVMYQMCLRLQ